MDGIHVGNEKYSRLVSQSQADIERSIERAGWSSAREAAHAKNMQQLMQVAGQFAKMSPMARTEVTQAKIAAQGAAPKHSALQPKEVPRHNSVARGGYTASQASAVSRDQGISSTIRPSIRKHMEQNMRRDARAKRRQALRQRAVGAVQNAARSAGRWTARQPQRLVQAMSQARLQRRQQRQQHLTHQAREKMMTPSPESQRSSPPKIRQQVAERTAQLGVSQRQTPERFIQPERSNQQHQQQPKKEQQRGPQHTR